MNSMKCFILHLPLFIFFLAGSARADGGDVLDRIVRLPGMKGTVYALLGKVSEQSGYLFIYDSKVIHNDSVVRVRKQECSVRQAIHRITGSRNTLHLHPPFGSDEQYLGFRMLRFDGIRNGHGRKYMSARSSSAHDNP